MKYVLAFITSLFLLSSPVVSFADTETVITTAGSLSDEQKTELAAQAAKMVAENASGTTEVGSSAKRVKEWVDIGTAIGSGIASTAKELGVAANDFVQTPVGKMAAAIIVWHFMGGSIVHIVFGTTWLFIMGTLWYILYRRASYSVITTEYEAGKGPGGVKRLTEKKPVDLSDGQNVVFVVGSLFIIAIGIIAIVTM